MITENLKMRSVWAWMKRIAFYGWISNSEVLIHLIGLLRILCAVNKWQKSIINDRGKCIRWLR